MVEHRDCDVSVSSSSSDDHLGNRGENVSDHRADHGELGERSGRHWLHRPVELDQYVRNDRRKRHGRKRDDCPPTGLAIQTWYVRMYATNLTGQSPPSTVKTVAPAP